MKDGSTGTSHPTYPPPTSSSNQGGDKEKASEVEGALDVGGSWTSGSFIPTGPSNGFIWSPAVDGPCTLTVHPRADSSTSSPVVRPVILGSLVGTLGACIYQVSPDLCMVCSLRSSRRVAFSQGVCFQVGVPVGFHTVFGSARLCAW